MYISTKSLETIKILLKTNLECCGNLLLPEELKIYNIKEDKKDGLFLYIENSGSHMCQNKIFTKYIWHTHPNISKSYPSVQDLFFTLRKTPNISIIFTKWGIWELYAGKKYNITKENIDYFRRKYIDDILAKIYFGTGKGKVDVLNKDQLSVVLEQTKNLNRIMTHFGFKFIISFTDWRDIGFEYILKFTN